MALRTIITEETEENEILRKKSKDVKNFGERTQTLLDDMWETMHEYDGVGLAAPQVGILRRAIIIDVTERDEEGNTIGSDTDATEPAPVNAPDGMRFELLNPEIIESDGEVCEKEGCLSVPGVSGLVKRPAHMKVSALDRYGKEIIVDGKGMLAKALSHEIDHLEGILFTDIAEEPDEDIAEQEPDEE
jgi:peptide deformylase